MKLLDRVWLFFNKKPHGGFTSYLGMVLPWLGIGIMLSFLLLALSFPGVPWYYFLSLIVWIFLLVFFCYWDDRKKGYLDAIHKRYLERRQERMDKINEIR